MSLYCVNKYSYFLCGAIPEITGTKKPALGGLPERVACLDAGEGDSGCGDRAPEAALVATLRKKGHALNRII